LRSSRWGIIHRGPFAFQTNSDLREFEFPWAYTKICERGKALDVVEIGGGMSGLQFALARAGHRVTNIDPGLKAAGKGWALDPLTHNKLCKAFGVSIDLVDTTIRQARLAPVSADVVASVSVLEHLAPSELAELVEEIPRILRPGGVLIATVDLFLDLSPFTTKTKNKWGTNLDIHGFIGRCGLTLKEGSAEELFGFPEFNSVRALENLPQYRICRSYPCLSECLVAGRR